ncbi:MAG: response regulator [Asticcacaulis sp.]
MSPKPARWACRSCAAKASTPARPGPDIILLDLNLPFMHGQDFLATVKEDPNLRRIPVIILSSSSAERDITACYNRHANGYITKPVTTETYDDIVERIESYWVWLDAVAAG